MDFKDYFKVPGVADDERMATQANMAIAQLLEALEFEVQGKAGDSDGIEKLVVGRNLFVDFLPLWYKEATPVARNPSDVWVLLNLEPLDMPSQQQSKNQKVDCLVRVEVHHGNRTTASQDVNRLFQFFLRRENAIQFEACNLSVRQASPTEAPSLIGMDESSRAVYAFRLKVRTVVLT